MGPFLSDHKLVSAVLNINTPPIEKKTLLVCKLKCITEETFKAAFNNEAIDLTSPVNTVLHQLNDEQHKALYTIAVKLLSTRGNHGLMSLSRLGIKWHEMGSGFGINTLNLIP